MAMSRQQACRLLDMMIGVSEGSLLGCSYWCSSLNNVMAAPEESRLILALAGLVLIFLGVTTIYQVYRQLRLLCEKLDVKDCTPGNFTNYLIPIIIIATFSRLFMVSYLDCAMIGGTSLIILGGCLIGLCNGGIYQLFRTLR